MCQMFVGPSEKEQIVSYWGEKADFSEIMQMLTHTDVEEEGGSSEIKKGGGEGNSGDSNFVMVTWALGRKVLIGRPGQVCTRPTRGRLLTMVGGEKAVRGGIKGKVGLGINLGAQLA